MVQGTGIYYLDINYDKESGERTTSQKFADVKQAFDSGALVVMRVHSVDAEGYTGVECNQVYNVDDNAINFINPYNTTITKFKKDNTLETK